MYHLSGAGLPLTTSSTIKGDISQEWGGCLQNRLSWTAGTTRQEKLRHCPDDSYAPVVRNVGRVDVLHHKSLGGNEKAAVLCGEVSSGFRPWYRCGKWGCEFWYYGSCEQCSKYLLWCERGCAEGQVWLTQHRCPIQAQAEGEVKIMLILQWLETGWMVSQSLRPHSRLFLRYATMHHSLRHNFPRSTNYQWFCWNWLIFYGENVFKFCLQCLSFLKATWNCCWR